MKRFLYTAIISVSCLLSSCSDFFEQTPDNFLESEDHYTTPSQIYANFMGLLATLQDVADDLIVVSDLRADIAMPTSKAPDEYWEVFNYTATNGNPLVSPAPLYRIVMNCNDFLRNTVAYNKKYPSAIPYSSYKQMIAGAVTLRAWAYLTIGKLYGGAVYYDYAMTGEVDLSKMEVMPFDQLIPELIFFMGRGVDNVSGYNRVDIDTMFGVDGAIWRRMAIQPDALMVELYLWNKEYEAAAKKGINIITGQALMEAGNNTNFTLSDLFGSKSTGNVANTTIARKLWRKLWAETPSGNHANDALTLVMYDYTKYQVNSLQYLCSTTAPNVFYLTPTAKLMDIYSGSDYINDKGKEVVDCRGNNASIAVENGYNVLCKYHCENRESYLTDAPIYIYRSADIHLMVIEALTALGNYDAADAMLNEGFSPYFMGGNVFEYPFNAPVYGYGKLAGGLGVRGRLGIPLLKSTDARFMGDMLSDDPAYNERRRFVLDSLVAEETAREFALEGKRWFTTMRIARNNNDPEFIANMLCDKRGTNNKSQFHAILRNPENWFIKYDLKLKNE